MQLGIGFFQPLLPHILADDLFTAMPPHCADKIALRPKLATPQLLLDRGYPPKNLSGGETFDHLDQLRWTVRGHRLDQEMDMIVIGADLQKHEFIPFGNLQTDLFEHGIHGAIKDHTSVLGRADHVINQDRNIMALVQVLAHVSDGTTPG